MRRISQTPRTLGEQLVSAGRGIQLEPAWPPSAPSQAAVEALGAEIADLLTQIVQAQNVLEGLRTDLARAVAEGQQMMRRVDHVTTMLYGETGPQKITYGLQPIDKTRNSPGPTPPVVGLSLSDGPVPGSLLARWKKVASATYEVRWFADEGLQTQLGAMAAPRNEALLALGPGVQVWVRVRALRRRRFGEWSEAATRIANV